MVTEDATVGVFGGVERTISTNLTVQECLQRLQGDNKPPLGLFGWKPFKHAPSIHRKLRNNQLKVLNSTGSQRIAWMFYAHVEECEGLATIKGRYRMATFLWVLFGIFALYATYTYVGSLLGYQVVSIARGNQGWRTMTPMEALIPGLITLGFLFLLYLSIGYFLRRKHAEQEQEIVDALQHVVAGSAPR